MIRSVSQKLNEYEASIRRLNDAINRVPKKYQAGKLVELAYACELNMARITESWSGREDKGLESTVAYCSIIDKSIRIIEDTLDAISMVIPISA